MLMFTVSCNKLIALVLRGIESDAKLPLAGPGGNPGGLNLSSEELL